MLIGSMAAAAGAAAVLLLAIQSLLKQGLTVSAVILPVIGAALLGAAAVLLHRRKPIASSIALIVWILLGVIPSGIPLWLGFVILALLVVAARGAFVLRRPVASGP
jgi:hypothetical protein